ncbi:MAG: response regulator [Desulfuromonadaceae bacterium]|nr:response regulator [Desulfuromonadaceae bacterium]
MNRSDEIISEYHHARIFVVEDDIFILPLLEQMLANYGFSVFPFTNGAEALEAVQQEIPDLILLDITMPGMDGYQVCERLKQNPDLKDIPVIFMSAMNSMEDKIKGFKVGGVDYITKPFHPEEVHVRVNTHLNLSALRNKLKYQKLVEMKVREVSEAQQATIFALAKLAEQRDDDTGAHLERVREYCCLLAQQLAKDSSYADHISEAFIDCIKHASPLHDIGKVAIPDSILMKPGKLTFEEFEIMKTHSIIGAENLQTVFNKYADNPFIGMGIEIALYHHERWDGAGYPDGLIGRNIPLSARIMAVADFYDALRSNRCYRKGFDHDKVKEMLLEEDGTHFDPEVIKAFLALEEQFSLIMKTQE